MHIETKTVTIHEKTVRGRCRDSKMPDKEHSMHEMERKLLKSDYFLKTIIIIQ